MGFAEIIKLHDWRLVHGYPLWMTSNGNSEKNWVQEWKSKCHLRIKSRDYDLLCDRCFDNTDMLFKHICVNEDGDGKEYILMVCWSCDHDIINGGDPFIDICDLIQDRRGQAYAEDPINNSPPWRC